ncbi:MAG TPA: hypothetical protein VLA12_08475, partial [Planctomycetaceae bacterium]|nr:hypothetical protein [Planctomycetaceae bacterium]
MKRFVSLDEADLLTYIAAAKRTALRLRDFLDNGGALIIRSAAPNLDIRVRKESTVARSKYTTSLLSPYFWLEETLGKFALVYGTRNAIRFLDKHSPIYSEFQDAPVDHAPSIQMVSTADVRVIADNGVSASQPTVFEIVNTSRRGSVFVVPRFNIPSEHLKLITAFHLLREQSSRRKIKPVWIAPFDERLANSDPVVQRISVIDDKISELKQERERLLVQRADNDQFTKLLCECGEELIATIASLFQRFGFGTREPSPLVERAEFDLYFSDTLRAHIVGSVVSTRDEPVPESVIDTLASKIVDSRFPEAPKGIIIANPQYHIDPDSRGPAFTDQFQERNREHGFCLLETTTLFEMGCQLLRAAAHNSESALQQALRRD